MLKRFLGGCGLACFLMSCQSGTKTLEPSKPSKVPVAAVWAGGPDGGAFIDCRPASEAHEYDCRIYNDHTGDLWDSGRYRLSSPSPAFDPRQGESYDGFDGERILLRDHRTLEKVTK